MTSCYSGLKNNYSKGREEPPSVCQINNCPLISRFQNPHRKDNRQWLPETIMFEECKIALSHIYIYIYIYIYLEIKQKHDCHRGQCALSCCCHLITRKCFCFFWKWLNGNLTEVIKVATLAIVIHQTRYGYWIITVHMGAYGVTTTNTLDANSQCNIWVFHLPKWNRINYLMDHFMNDPSQWDTTLHCIVVFRWLGAYTKWSQYFEEETNMRPILLKVVWQV